MQWTHIEFCKHYVEDLIVEFIGILEKGLKEFYVCSKVEL